MKAKGKKKGKKALIIIVVILVLIIIIGAVSCSMMPDVAAVVTTTTATRGDLQESISTSGTVASEEKTIVFAPVGGIIGEVAVAAGDTVKAGDVLIGYDLEEAEDAFTQATLQQAKNTASYNGLMADNSENQAKLNEANTNLAVLEQQLEDYNNYLESLQDKLTTNQRETGNALSAESYNLSSRSSVLQEQLEALDRTAPDYAEQLTALQNELQSVSTQIARNQYLQQVSGSTDYVVKMEDEIAEVQKHIAECEAYKAEMESQKASSEAGVLDSYAVEQYSVDKELAEISYKAAEEDYYLAKQGVVAAFDGIVTECVAVEGSAVMDGAQLLTLESSNDVKVEFSVSKYDLEKLVVGQQVTVTILGKEYEGTVSKIDKMATTSVDSKTPMVGAEVHITNPDDDIILGMDAKLEINTKKSEAALMVPVEVINADADGDFLYVVENGIVVRKAIVCGISTDTHTEVLEGITEADEIVVMSLTGNIEEGMAVTAMPEQ